MKNALLNQSSRNFSLQIDHQENKYSKTSIETQKVKGRKLKTLNFKLKHKKFQNVLSSLRSIKIARTATSI
jgi:hypothetical protein